MNFNKIALLAVGGVLVSSTAFAVSAPRKTVVFCPEPLEFDWQRRQKGYGSEWVGVASNWEGSLVSLQIRKPTPTYRGGVLTLDQHTGYSFTCHYTVPHPAAVEQKVIMNLTGYHHCEPEDSITNKVSCW